MSKIKNILIFVTIGAVLLFVYFKFIRSSDTPTASLTSDTSSMAVPGSPVPASDPNSEVSQNFLSTLLNVSSIKLDTTILADPAFQNLTDSTVLLTPDPDPGRPNPFAQFGNDVTAATVSPSDASTASGTADTTATGVAPAMPTGALTPPKTATTKAH